MVLTERALQGLKGYRYRAGGYTWLDAAHEPLWRNLVNKLPLWLAPNVITLAGTLCIVAAYALNIIYNPSFVGEAPAWVSLFTAASIVLYVNLDCMDGKQARRTGSSSPLGQLFDHGCDALALHMILANIAASLGVGCGGKMAAGCLGIMVPWMLAQWEEYHTGIMMYGNKWYGVLEANYSICAVHLLSAALGLRFWQTQVPLPRPIAWALGALGESGQMLPLVNSGSGSSGILEMTPMQGFNGSSQSSWGLSAAASPASSGGLSSAAVMGGHLSIAELALLLVGFAGICQGVTNVVRVFTSPALDPKESGNKQLGRRWALLHLAGLLLTIFLGAWSVSVSASPEDAQWAQHIAARLHDAQPALGSNVASWLLRDLLPAAECRAAFSMFGFLYALTATQLIVAHMSKEPWLPSLLALTLPLLHVASVLGWWHVPPHALLLGLHTVALAVWASYVLGAISQICEFLGIKCLSIKAPPPPSSSSKASN